MTLIDDLRSRVATKLGAAPVNVACCFEAGRDGFWLYRVLTAHGIAAYVLEPTSILVNRRARRAKTDRLDAEGMLRVLAAWLNGGTGRYAAWCMCLPLKRRTPSGRTAKRVVLVQERLRIENRIEALLFTQGIRGRPSLRSWERDMAELRTGDGRKLPPLLRAELDRLRRRLVLTLELIREMETERAEALTATSGAVTTQEGHGAAAYPRHWTKLCRHIGGRGSLPIVCQPPTTCQLRRHCTDALPKRRH